MLYSFLLQIQKMLGVALPSGFATPTFIIEPFFYYHAIYNGIETRDGKEFEIVVYMENHTKL